MSCFPATPTELLTQIAAQAAGEDEAAWRKLVDLYVPAMYRYLLGHGATEADVDDQVQNVLVKLVGILREGKYDRDRGRFRSYLSTLLVHELIRCVRRAGARGGGRHVPLDDASDEIAAAAKVEPDVYAVLEGDWRRDCRATAVQHVLENTALAETSKRVFQELERTGDSCEAVARRLSMTAASVRQIKSRVGRMVAAVERRLLGDDVRAR